MGCERLPHIATLWCLFAGWNNAVILQPTRWTRLPIGAVKPRGWLLTQTRLQAAALTSHLPLFWPNIANTSWLGGSSDNDGGLHESTPYWLNGATPLAIQLSDTYPELLIIVERYIDGILSRQASDGWLGPDTDVADFWSRYPFILALMQYHESVEQSPRKQRVLKSMVRFFNAVDARLSGGVKLSSWSSSRAHDLIWAIHYVVDVLSSGPSDSTSDATIESLLTLAARMHEQALNWHDDWFNSSKFPQKAVTQGLSDFTHGVNNAQAVKHGAVWARQSGDLHGGVSASWLAWVTLMRYHGQPNGVFAADEHLAGRMPSRGSELCIVAESMWSLTVLAQVAPTDGAAVRALDALENIAFNALPGSLSDDLWSHPYLQFVNGFQASPNELDHIWANDGPDAAMYGLEPNYECCTANYHQAYAKLVSHLFFSIPDENVIVSTVWAPSFLSVDNIAGGIEIETRTDYPFALEVDYIIKNQEHFRFRVRLPEFLRDVAGRKEGLATVKVWVEGHERLVEVVDGFLEYLIPAWRLPDPRVGLRIKWKAPPKIQRSDSAEQGASVFVGPLLMALDLGEQRYPTRRYEFDAADWNTTATKPWRYGLPLSKSNVFGPVTRQAPGALPFEHNLHGCPLKMNATLVQVPPSSWRMMHGAPGALPASHELAALVEDDRVLLPYACTSIRIAAFPEVSVTEVGYVI